MSTLNVDQQKRGWGLWATLALTIAIFMLGQIIGAILLNVVLVILGIDQEAGNKILRTFLFFVFAEGSTLGVLITVTHYRQLTLPSLGLGHPRFKYIGYALLGFGLYFLLYMSFMLISKALFPSLNLNQEQDIGFNSATRGTALILVFISLVILPPITEEILMRGFLFGGLRRRLPFVGATLITSTLFALGHLPSGKDGLLWIGALDTFILSFVLCYLRETTKSLWPSIGLHMTKNFVAFIVLFGFLR